MACLRSTPEIAKCSSRNDRAALTKASRGVWCSPGSMSSCARSRCPRIPELGRRGLRSRRDPRHRRRRAGDRPQAACAPDHQPRTARHRIAVRGGRRRAHRGHHPLQRLPGGRIEHSANRRQLRRRQRTRPAAEAGPDRRLVARQFGCAARAVEAAGTSGVLQRAAATVRHRLDDPTLRPAHRQRARRRRRRAQFREPRRYAALDVCRARSGHCFLPGRRASAADDQSRAHHRRRADALRRAQCVRRPCRIDSVDQR